MIIITNHGKERIKKRIGVSKSLSEKIAVKALEKGLKHSDTKGKLKKFLDGLYLSHKTANNMRIYARKIFLFRDNLLITVIDLPKQFHKTVDKINNKVRKIEFYFKKKGG